MKLITVLSFLGMFLASAGCTTAMYPGPARQNSEIATIQSIATRVSMIDGQEPSYSGGNYASYQVLPGERVISVVLNDGGIRLGRTPLTVRFRAEAGRTYLTKPVYEGKKWRPVIVDKETNQVVSY